MAATTETVYKSWHIWLLGGLCVEVAGRTFTRFRTHNCAALLAYLAYFPHRPHTRDSLIELLWPEVEPTTGRNRLKQELSSLRRQLEPPGVMAGTVLCADYTQVQINREAVTTDVEQFQQALKAAEGLESEEAQIPVLSQAVELYRGDLLPAFDAEWIVLEREKLHRAYLRALRELVRCLAKAGQFERAIEAAHRAIQADPLQEASYRDLMRLYKAVGKPQAALRQYEDLQRILQEQLGARPAESTRDLAKSLSANAQFPPAPSPSRPEGGCPNSLCSPSSNLRAAWERQGRKARGEEGVRAETHPSLPAQYTRLFGRRQEIARLQELLAPPCGSEPEPASRLVTLTGPGGSGKTRLALEVASRLAASYGGAVWFVPLASLSDAQAIPAAIAESMGLS